MYLIPRKYGSIVHMESCRPSLRKQYGEILLNNMNGGGGDEKVGLVEVLGFRDEALHCKPPKADL